MNLCGTDISLPLIILSLHSLAVLAEPISASRIDSLIPRNVASRTAIFVVVMNSIIWGFVGLVYRMIDSSGHSSSPPIGRSGMPWLISSLPSEMQ